MIQVDRPIPLKNDIGGITPTYRTIGTYPTRVVPLNATEKIEFQTETTQYTHKLYFMPTADIKNGDLLHFKGRLFDGVSVVNVHELDSYFIVYATEVA